jgi:hypothetical protein
MIDVTNDDEVLFARLEHFLILSGLAVQSRAKLWRYFGRWVRRLRVEGHTSIGYLPLAQGWSWDEVQTANWINLFLAERSSDTAKAHELRNLTGVRPPKP